ncbi:hypothetical protein DAETH_24370 [Deinococcus aetherius]|uniref:Uncharacterized protein n=1 Tax=Deinococcus aetherius TaxID=200252 RepID=A0ABM8AF86_9DEIO|nr:hypothetical protein [Deinococcus aetherius]BDP42468.1 hypothetical protein DAETH_24370 [Deinococcus aetherius]
MNTSRHFSDTRTAEGRVRFLLSAGGVRLIAEGPGWHHDSLHATLEDAATFLAVVPFLGQDLYEQAIGDLERRARVDEQVDGAA